MNEGGHGRRTFHGIGQPDVQREHGTLSGTTDEHEEEAEGQHGSTCSKAFLAEVKAERLAVVAVDEDTDEEEEVGEAGDDECLLGGCDGSGRLVVETNQEIRRHTHQLPEHIHLEDVGRHDESEHGHGEEAEEGIVALEASFAVHVAERVDVDHQRDGGDDDEHHDGDGVKEDAHVKAESVDEEGEPGDVVGDERRERAFCGAFGQEEIIVGSLVRQQCHYRQHSSADKTCRFVAEPFSEHSEEEEGEEWQQEDENC